MSDGRRPVERIYRAHSHSTEHNSTGPTLRRLFPMPDQEGTGTLTLRPGVVTIPSNLFDRE